MLTRGAAARALQGQPAADSNCEAAASVCERQPESSAPRVTHIRQVDDWDCGLACVLMVLRALGATQCDFSTMRLLCQTTSVWTIDLAHLLRRFGVEVTFCTVTLGANPDFVHESFYVGTMEEDGRRVEHLFRNAATLGIPVERRSVTLDEMRTRVTHDGCVVIALVDKRKLNDHLTTSPELQHCLGVSSGYMGHYILVCGYSAEQRSFVVQDPASSRADIMLPEAALDSARKTFGTDEDLLFVRMRRALAEGAESAVLQAL